MIIPTDDARAFAAIDAIHTGGDLATLRRFLAQHPELVTAALGTDGNAA